MNDHFYWRPRVKLVLFMQRNCDDRHGKLASLCHLTISAYNPIF
jgi:hypothetical protein